VTRSWLSSALTLCLISSLALKLDAIDSLAVDAPQSSWNSFFLKFSFKRVRLGLTAILDLRELAVAEDAVDQAKI
jgi:hypothetical protein